jgi:hypothetical protein
MPDLAGAPANTPKAPTFQNQLVEIDRFAAVVVDAAVESAATWVRESSNIVSPLAWRTLALLAPIVSLGLRVKNNSDGYINRTSTPLRQPSRFESRTCQPERRRSARRSCLRDVLESLAFDFGVGEPVEGAGGRSGIDEAAPRQRTWHPPRSPGS